MALAVCTRRPANWSCRGCPWALRAMPRGLCGRPRLASRPLASPHDVDRARKLFRMTENRGPGRGRGRGDSRIPVRAFPRFAIFQKSDLENSTPLLSMLLSLGVESDRVGSRAPRVAGRRVPRGIAREAQGHPRHLPFAGRRVNTARAIHIRKYSTQRKKSFFFPARITRPGYPVPASVLDSYVDVK